MQGQYPVHLTSSCNHGDQDRALSEMAALRADLGGKTCWYLSCNLHRATEEMQDHVPELESKAGGCESSSS